MSLNWKEIDLILQELNLENSSIQKVRQPDFRTLILDLYAPGRRQSLLIALSQGKTRLHALKRKVKNQVPLQRFAQLLRSRIQGGRIISAEQIEEERIVQIEIARAGETSHLFLRLWGGAGNIIATDESYTILDAFYRRPKRGEVSGHIFRPQDLIEKTKQTGRGTNKEFSIRPYPEGESFNAAIEREYFAKEENEELQRLEEKAQGIIERQRRNLEQKKEELRTQLDSQIEIQQYKEIGDILMANLHAIPPKSSRTRLDDFYHEGQSIEIELDPALSPQQNAEKYYKRYQKLHKKNQRMQEESQNIEESAAALERERQELLSIEESSDRIEALREFIETHTPSKGAKQESPLPGLRFQSGPFPILVGRSSKENDTLLRHYVRGNDYWMHSRDYPGGYVFIKYISGKSVPLETLLDAGNLALHYSKDRSAGKGELYYTQVKYLRRAKEGKQGLVIPTQEKNISIELDEKRLQRIFSRNGTEE